MKTVCVIAEYHPFHNGHARMAALLHAMGYEAVIAVMSGNFVQRGVPALLPKEVRAAAALRGGVDLVLELPCQAAADTAQRFAAAGVAAAAACGADALAFGAEDADLEVLEGVCDALCSPGFSLHLKTDLAAGRPFHTARAAAAEVFCPGAAAVLAQPNNILAIEYLLALRRLRAALPAGTRLPLPLPLPRFGAAHDAAPCGDIAGAAWLRARPVGEWAAYVPAAAQLLYLQAQRDGRLLDEAHWQCTALSLLRTRTPAQLAALPDAGEGLDALLYAAIRDGTTLENIYGAVKSKRYTHARVRRLTLAAVLGWTAPGAAVGGLTDTSGIKTGIGTAKEPAAFSGAQSKTDAARRAAAVLGCGGQLPYLRVLGGTATGLRALGQLAAASPLPVSSSLAVLQRRGGDCAAAAEREAAAGDVYALCLQNPAPCGQEYRLPFLKA